MLDLCRDHYRLPGNSLFTTNNYIKCSISFQEIPKWTESNRIGHFERIPKPEFTGFLNKCKPHACSADIRTLASDFQQDFRNIALECYNNSYVIETDDAELGNYIKLGGICEVKCLNGKVPEPGNVSGEMSKNFVQKNIRNYKIVCVENNDGEAVWTRNHNQ